MKKLAYLLASVGMMLAALAVNIVFTMGGLAVLVSGKITDALSQGLQRFTGLEKLLKDIISDGDLVMEVTLIGTVGVGIVFVLWYRLVFAKKITSDAKLSFAPRQIISIVLIGVFLQISVSLILTLVLPLFGNIASDYDELTSSLTQASPLITAVTIGLAAPIAEECVFRGCILRTLEKQFPFFVANIIQALLFGLYHMNIVQGIYTFLIGMVFGYVVHRTKRIIPSMLLHASLNLSAFLLDFLQEQRFFESDIVTIAAMLGSAAGVVFFILLIKDVPGEATAYDAFMVKRLPPAEALQAPDGDGEDPADDFYEE
ncbi:MAG: CPBP family intramembrane metalloprotease [Lachnospiraceae bacterium]|nr:CPBP family intramembrane metalloprotease [Lachnospiraceae bacterium]